MNGLFGGMIQVGRFRVIVPPGAITGTATITVSVPDRSRLQCDFSISPASSVWRPVSFGVNAQLVVRVRLCHSSTDAGGLGGW